MGKDGYTCIDVYSYDLVTETYTEQVTDDEPEPAAAPVAKKTKVAASNNRKPSAGTKMKQGSILKFFKKKE